MKKKLSQSKLEFAVAVGFSLLILILSSTDVGYIKISPYRNLDMGIIPAIFAAMIGGYRVGIPVAILWAGVTYFNPASNLQIYGLPGLIINSVVLVTVVYHAYKVCKKYYTGSPYNVYRALVAGIVAKNLVSNAILVWMLIKVERVFKLEVWLRYTTQHFVLELALCTLAMAFLIKHLRQVHILNGIKRREKAKVDSKL
jgi:riboflavin transporter FmnP